MKWKSVELPVLLGKQPFQKACSIRHGLLKLRLLCTSRGSGGKRNCEKGGGWKYIHHQSVCQMRNWKEDLGRRLSIEGDSVKRAKKYGTKTRIFVKWSDMLANVMLNEKRKQCSLMANNKVGLLGLNGFWVYWVKWHRHFREKRFSPCQLVKSLYPLLKF